VPDVVICEPVRTPVGRYGGIFETLPATALIEAAIRGLLERTGMPGERVGDVLLGQCYPSGEAPAIGRVAALDSGLPEAVSGLQIDRRCGSGLMAVLYAAMQVGAGVHDLVLAGGVESMSQVEFYAPGRRKDRTSEGLVLQDRLERARVTAGGRDYPVPGGLLETAENLRREYAISRLEQDELAVSSHQKAVRAQVAGLFDDEIVPVPVETPTGTTLVTHDEHPRPHTTLEKLANLRPVRAREDPEATVTAGNSSGQNDGAAICAVATRETAESLGLKPLARVVSWAVTGVAPRLMGIGPVPATRQALKTAGLSLADIGLLEINEAFAAQVLACFREWGLTPGDRERVNVNGSGISLGHPVGATGGRILATLLREMQRRGERYGVETMCIGGGQGLSAVFELVR
jgi:acetyl-CoA C-acetyltransferase